MAGGGQFIGEVVEDVLNEGAGARVISGRVGALGVWLDMALLVAEGRAGRRRGRGDVKGAPWRPGAALPAAGEDQAASSRLLARSLRSFFWSCSRVVMARLLRCSCSVRASGTLTLRK